jgi:hypothetical protein
MEAKEPESGVQSRESERIPDGPKTLSKVKEIVENEGNAFSYGGRFPRGFV